MLQYGERLRRAMSKRYERMKENFLQERAALVPPEFRSSFVSYKGSAEIQYLIEKSIPTTAKRVLVIGVFGGRDYFFLKARSGHEVHALDLELRPGFEKMVTANVEESLPYPDQFFDAIVLNEVLEHLVHDANALGHIRRVLADSGVLFMSVPFLHEAEPSHVRVHNRESVLRLLACCGFEATAVYERPGLGFYLPWINQINFAASLAMLALTGRTAYEVTLPWLGGMERWAGSRQNPLRRLSSYWGAYFVCRKGAKRFDYLDQNKKDFGLTVGAHPQASGSPATSDPSRPSLPTTNSRRIPVGALSRY